MCLKYKKSQPKCAYKARAYKKKIKKNIIRVPASIIRGFASIIRVSASIIRISFNYQFQNERTDEPTDGQTDGRTDRHRVKSMDSRKHY